MVAALLGAFGAKSDKDVLAGMLDMLGRRRDRSGVGAVAAVAGARLRRSPSLAGS